jgi:RHS repeat-associated protein
VWRRDQGEPFGDSPSNEDPDGNSNPFEFNLRFPGQYFDKESNLAHNMERDYEAAIGRYVQSDPIGLAGDLHGFSYVNANPINFVDPSGLLKCWWVGLVLRCEWGPPPAGPLDFPSDKTTGASSSGSSSKEQACSCDDPPYNKYIKCIRLYGYLSL